MRTPVILSLLGVGTAIALAPGCYSEGSGTPPPGNTLYFPVGLGVSIGGNVLYVANSDFDLQWNGGTVQSYDLHLIRRNSVVTIHDPRDPNLHIVPGHVPPPGTSCADPPVYQPNGSGSRQPLGLTCAPPVDSTWYVRDSAVIGAFATDLQVSSCAVTCIDGGIACTTRKSACAGVSGRRLFVPVRGDATLTWAEIVPDDPNVAPPADPSVDYPPFRIACGQHSNNGRCDGPHHAGGDPNENGNTRHVVMPGEPFGMAQSEDGSSIAITHQTDTKTSLFTTGLGPSAPVSTPAIEYVLDGLPIGGNGIAAVPHDVNAFPGGPSPGQAWLETSRNAAEIDLLRFYADIGAPLGDAGGGGTQSALTRPFIQKEATFPLTANSGGTDSRGIAIDPSPRIACMNALSPADRADPNKVAACARTPARVFIANRSPASLLVGEIGGTTPGDNEQYDPDRLVIYKSIPLTVGPSRVYLAPVVGADGRYALRVFIVCFDSATLFIYDPDANLIENSIRVGDGPFAMAFDPWDPIDVATNAVVPMDPREPGGVSNGTGWTEPLRRYRFAYVASFTKSFIQVIDLDNSPDTAVGRDTTFEQVVFTLGLPTLPRGSQ